MDWPLPPGPLVVASVNGPEDMRWARSAERIADHCDALEWRLDGLQDAPVAEVAAALAACPVPALLTARHEGEGGFAPWPAEPARLAAAAAHLAPGRLLDIEARSLQQADPAWRTLAARCHHEGVALVVSLHDFAGIPASATIADAARAALAHKASVLKVAATARSLDEVVALAAVFRAAAPLPVAVMAMGPFGLGSRLLFAQAGSVLNYGFLRSASVPGQWPAAELKRLLAAAGES